MSLTTVADYADISLGNADIEDKNDLFMLIRINIHVHKYKSTYLFITRTHTLSIPNK